MTTDPTQLQESIARAIYEAEIPSPRYKWAALRNEAKDHRRQQAAAVLPIVRAAQAAAWDACVDAAYMDEFEMYHDPNPYREQED